MGFGCLRRIDRLISTTDVLFIKCLVKQQAGEGLEPRTQQPTKFILATEHVSSTMQDTFMDPAEDQSLIPRHLIHLIVDRFISHCVIRPRYPLPADIAMIQDVAFKL